MPCQTRDATQGGTTPQPLQRLISQACQTSERHSSHLLALRLACQSRRPLDRRPPPTCQPRQPTTPSPQVMQQQERQQNAPRRSTTPVGARKPPTPPQTAMPTQIPNTAQPRTSRWHGPTPTTHQISWHTIAAVPPVPSWRVHRRNETDFQSPLFVAQMVC